MARHRLLTVTAALALAALASPGRAQDKPEPPPPEPAKVPAPAKAERPADRPEGATLRVLLVISRFEGEKKLASLPYTFTVTSDGRSARVRMGVETPIPVAHGLPGLADVKPPTSYQYRNVGTNLDCSARATKDGRYQLQISVENSSTLSGTGTSGMPPLFRTFNVNL